MSSIEHSQQLKLSYKTRTEPRPKTRMPEAVRSESPNAAQRARIRALVVPREHGAWGLMLVPLFTGIAAGIASTHRFLPLLVLTIAALSLFWLRTPLESLLGTGTIKARTSRERWAALLASLFLAAVSAASLAGLMWQGRNLGLLLLGAASAFAFLVQSALRRLGRWARMPSQLIGVIGLTCAAPAAYYVGTGHLSERAFLLWASNWIFAGNQIHFVQLRIHAARDARFSEKIAQGRMFFLAQPALLVAMAFASFWRSTPHLIIIAFVPALLRGTLWFFRKPEPLNVKSLGWSEMKQGVIFGILLAAAFIYS